MKNSNSNSTTTHRKLNTDNGRGISINEGENKSVHSNRINEGKMAVQVHYNSWYISLPSFAKQQGA